MGALEVLLISFGAGVAPAGAADCSVTGTAGAMLLAALLIYSLWLLRERLRALPSRLANLLDRPDPGGEVGTAGNKGVAP